MSPRLLRAFLAPLALAFFTACSGGGGSSSLPAQKSALHPASAGVATRHAAGVSNGSLFQPNTIKYSDTGSQPATGRSGSATIQSRALIAKDGSTLVESTTGVLDGATGAGAFKHVQAKIQDTAGSTQRALNYTDLTGGYWSQTYSGIARNDTIQLQQNITGVDAPRTDVVTTVATAKLRPDLSVLRISAPSKAYVHAPVNFTATVGELNGDVGARADCVLSVDGQQVAQALGIWVDAGHTVACAFTTTFATTGTKNVVVSATNVVPGDWDLSNNSASTTIQIVDPVVSLGYYAGAETYHYAYNYASSYSSSYYYNSGTSSGSGTSDYADAYIEGYTTRHKFQFPVQLSANVTADGTSILQNTATTLTPQFDNGYYTCSSSYAAGNSAGACSADDGSFSYAYYEAYKEDVTYYDQGVNCSYYGCSSYSYIYNISVSGALTTYDIGSSDQFTLDVVDAGGTTYRAASAAVATTPFSYQYNPNYCYSYYYGSYCESGTFSYVGKSVSTSGPEGGT